MIPISRLAISGCSYLCWPHVAVWGLQGVSAYAMLWGVC